MKRSLNELRGYDIKAKDGLKGSVKDFLFDEERWIIRYLEADLGVIFSGRKVLIPKMFLKDPDWAQQQYPVELSSSDIERCPELEEKLPVSRKYEEQLNRYYKISDYWAYAHTSALATPGITHPPRPIQTFSEIVIDENNINTHLRSFNEIKGYHVVALDGEIGHIDDIIVDTNSWQIIYGVVDTSNWLPWSKKVLIGVHRMEEISYVEKKININLHVETIKMAPEFDPSTPVNEEVEKQLYDYFGRPVIQE